MTDTKVDAVEVVLGAFPDSTVTTAVDVVYWQDVYEHTRFPMVRRAAAAALMYEHDTLEMAIKHLEDHAQWFEDDPAAAMGTPEGAAACAAQDRLAAAHLATYLRGEG